MLLKECLNTFLQAVDYPLAKKDAEQALLENIAAEDKPINTTLYQQYGQNLRKAVDGVFHEDTGDGLSDQLRANVSRFAAYKAYHATQQVREQISKGGDVEAGRKVLHAFNRYQAAEYNTSVARCRTAKQWQEFETDDNMRLFPNLRWLPSRSATIREEHAAFYNRVWPKDDPFWNTNQPGNLWNCKCDWEETADPATDGNPTTAIRHNGLEGNPAKTGEVFTDNSTYVKKAGTNRTERDKVEMMCERLNQNITTIKAKSELLNKTTECTINEKKYEILFEPIGIEHFAQDCFGNKELFWIKNEMLTSIDRHLKDLSFVGKKKSDTNHNTNKKTLRLKRQTDYFYYSPIDLPNGKTAVLHLGRFNSTKKGKEGKLYLYSITKEMPKNIEDL